MNRLASAGAALHRQFAGTNSVDEWGMDADTVGLTRFFASLRWHTDVVGAAHVPPRGPALLIANRRSFDTTPVLVATTLGGACGRPVRFAGVPDLAPLGPFLRRSGGVIARPDEIAGLLRAGEVAAVWCTSPLLDPRRVGPAPLPYLEVAVELHVPVVPVAVNAAPLGRRARVEAAPPIDTSKARGPLATTELAELVRRTIQRLTDEVNPLARLPFL